MKKVGVTGGIGSGKTTICNIFSSLGIPVYNADQRAKEIMNSNPIVKSAVVEAFGAGSYVSGSLNRDYIAKEVFDNQTRLKKLNSIVHPQVALDYKIWLSQHQYFPYTIKEAALLIESGAYRELDHMIHVIAPLELKIKRVQKRDSFRTSEEIKNIIDRQMSDDMRDAKADIKICNDGNKLLIPQVLVIHEELLVLR